MWYPELRMIGNVGLANCYKRSMTRQPGAAGPKKGAYWDAAGRPNRRGGHVTTRGSRAHRDPGNQ